MLLSVSQCPSGDPVLAGVWVWVGGVAPLRRAGTGGGGWRAMGGSSCQCPTSRPRSLCRANRSSDRSGSAEEVGPVPAGEGKQLTLDSQDPSGPRADRPTEHPGLGRWTDGFRSRLRSGARLEGWSPSHCLLIKKTGASFAALAGTHPWDG